MARFTMLPLLTITLLIAVMMELQAQNTNYNNNPNPNYNNNAYRQQPPALQQPTYQEQSRNPVPPSGQYPQGNQQQQQQNFVPPVPYQPTNTNQYQSAPQPPSSQPGYTQPQGAPVQAPPGVQAPAGSGGGSLDQNTRDVLQKFDDYLFDNLEQVYFRMSYAFKDVVKKTLDKCGCDAGATLTSDTSPAPAPGPAPPK